MAKPLANKVALVTGSTDGIGLHTATRLASDGATVLLHGRKQDRLKSALDEVQSQSNNDKVQGILADISTLKGMHALCSEVSKLTDKLDILVSNAGIFYDKREVTEDGIELVFATNVVAPFVTTAQLLPLLRNSQSARIITVSSMSQGYAQGLEDPQFESGGFSDHKSYSLSKLCDAMLSMELHERYGPSSGRSSNLHFNTLDPGTVNTKMLIAGWGACGIKVSQANDQYKLATSAALEGVSGKYYISGRETRANAACYDASARSKLWQYLTELSGVQYD